MAHAPEPTSIFLKEIPELEDDRSRLVRLLRQLEERGLVTHTIEASGNPDDGYPWLDDWWELTPRGRSAIEAPDEVRWMRLDERARDWARSQLALGKTLARACGHLVEQGEPWARLPDASPEWIYNFERGTAGRERVRERQPVWLQMWDAAPVEALMDFLLRDDPAGQPVIIYEVRLAKASDPWVQHQDAKEQYARGRLRFLGEEVYDCVSRRELDHHPRPFILGEYPTLGVVTYWPPEHNAVTAPGDLTAERVEALAAQAVALLVGAWDEENYLVMDKGFLAGVGVTGTASEGRGNP